MHDEPERAAVAERVDLGLVALAPDKRVVSWHAAVVIEAQHLASVAHGVLRAAAVARVAERADVELAVAAECEPRDAARVRRDEDVAHIRQRLAVPGAARDTEAILPLRDRLVVAQIDKAVRRELRMQRDIEEARKTLHAHLGHARDWLWIEHAVAHDAQGAGALCHEHLAARQPHEAPRTREPARVDDDANLLLRGLVRERSGAERRHDNAVRWARNSAVPRAALLLLLGCGCTRCALL